MLDKHDRGDKLMLKGLNMQPNASQTEQGRQKIRP